MTPNPSVPLLPLPVVTKTVADQRSTARSGMVISTPWAKCPGPQVSGCFVTHVWNPKRVARKTTVVASSSERMSAMDESHQLLGPTQHTNKHAVHRGCNVGLREGTSPSESHPRTPAGAADEALEDSQRTARQRRPSGTSLQGLRAWAEQVRGGPERTLQPGSSRRRRGQWPLSIPSASSPAGGTTCAGTPTQCHTQGLRNQLRGPASWQSNTQVVVVGTRAWEWACGAGGRRPR